VLVWLLVQQFMPVFGGPSAAPSGAAAMLPPSELSAKHRIMYANTAVVYGLFGGIVAAFFAVAEGAARRSAGYALVGALLGLVIGAVFGALGGGVGQFIQMSTEPAVDRMVKTMMVHAAGWSITGLGVGLGFAIASWRGKIIGLAVLGGIVAGGVSALLFSILAGLLFTGFNTDLVVPAGSGARLFWFVLTSSLMAIVVGGLRGTRPRRAPQPAPATSA
jgi:hypothetical protein